MNQSQFLFACLSAAAGVIANSEPLPAMVCREGQALSISNPSLQLSRYPSSALYRFEGMKLYLSDDSRAEYLYNSVKVGDGDFDGFRFFAGNKSLLFSKDFSSATVVHLDSLEVRVSRLRCTRT